MFHRIERLDPLPDHVLQVRFAEGVTKACGMKPLFGSIPAFAYLLDHPGGYLAATVGAGGFGVVFNDALGLSCGELRDHGRRL
ncbi:MAG: DUF2442 domain-containing protein [Duodenibacillus sp.]|nr:DUF2442 domain-containing protein [Duodenibacillus sp.]